MGLFSSKKTYVSSTVYNMAGAIEDRPNFLKTLITANALGVNTGPIADQIQKAYGSGPGARIRNFATWARNNYKVVGVAQGNLYSRIDVPSDQVAAQIIHDPNSTVSIQRVEAKMADYSYWAEQWMLANEPELIGTEWESDYNESTNTITIRFADGGSVDFVPNGFRKSSAYIYAVYTLNIGEETGRLERGSYTELRQDEPYPSVTGWEMKTNISTNVPVNLEKITQVTTSYSDGREPVVLTSLDGIESSYSYYRAVYERKFYTGAQPGSSERITGVRQVMNLFRDATVDEQVTTTTSNEQIEGGVTKTTTTKVTETKLIVSKAYRQDQQDITLQTTSPAKMFIYRLGSGNPTLDKLVAAKPDTGFYLPFIPVRLDNKFLSQVSPTAFEASERAYKKATGAKLEDLEDSLKENKDLKDIDYAYIMFGVSLNTKEETGRQYLFRFFEKLRLTQSTDRDDYAIWAAQQNDFDAANSELNDWRLGQFDPNSPYYGEDSPNVGKVSAMPTSEVRIKGSGSLSTNLDIQISWQSITKATGTGVARPNAKKGDYWLVTGATDTFGQSLIVGGIKQQIAAQSASRITIYHQIDATHWEALTIIGLVHKNFIYKGKFVEITGKEALADNEESGFLVPLHYGTLKEMSLIDSTQLATACCYLVINSYLVKKTGFFASTFFKILLVVAVIAITVATGGTGAGSIGLLGANAAVGMAIGLTGTLAIIAGAVANALVAMILTKIISIGAVALFGDKLGSIIGAIASVVALQVGTSMLGAGNGLAASIGTMARADNIIAMTSAVGGGISGYIQAGAMNTVAKTQQLQEDYQKESLELADKYASEFGGRAMLDPLSLANRDQFTMESASTFLERTLMTGSDVAEMSLSLLTNYTDITLSVDLPL